MPPVARAALQRFEVDPASTQECETKSVVDRDADRPDHRQHRTGVNGKSRERNGDGGARAEFATYPV